MFQLSDLLPNVSKAHISKTGKDVFYDVTVSTHSIVNQSPMIQNPIINKNMVMGFTIIYPR